MQNSEANPIYIIISLVLFGFMVYGCARCCGDCSGRNDGPVRVVTIRDDGGRRSNHSVVVLTPTQYGHQPRVPSSPTSFAQYGNSSSDAGQPIAIRVSDCGARPSAVSMGHVWDDPVVIASRVPFEAVTTQTLIGRGSLCDVYSGVFGDAAVAVKRLTPAALRNANSISALFMEGHLMASVPHDRIVQFIGISWSQLNRVSVLSELMEGGDLRTLVAQWNDEKRPQGWDTDKNTIALDVAEALAFLHSLSPGVLHGALKSKNVLLDCTRTTAKLASFGGIRSLRTMASPVAAGGAGSSAWMAPEVLRGGQYGEKADVYSFGVILSELDTHALPYTTCHGAPVSPVAATQGAAMSAELRRQIVEGKAAITFSETLRSDVRAVAQACVSRNPNERPAMAVVVETLQLALTNSSAAAAAY
ncbi:hypothetical protein ATCC90586_003057 [Pythium insidiosum]|nr:hypothetical protein ATCC90586_003057 [Pythium insidiosum]